MPILTNAAHTDRASRSSTKTPPCISTSFIVSNIGTDAALIEGLLLAGDLRGTTRVFVSRPGLFVNAIDLSDWRNFLEVGLAEGLGKKVKEPVEVELHTAVPLTGGSKCCFYVWTSEASHMWTHDNGKLSLAQAADHGHCEDSVLSIEGGGIGGKKLVSDEYPDDRNRAADPPLAMVRAKGDKAFQDVNVAHTAPPQGGVKYTVLSGPDGSKSLAAAKLKIESRLFSLADYLRVGNPFVGIDPVNFYLIDEATLKWCVWRMEGAPQTADTYLRALAHKPKNTFKPPAYVPSKDENRRASMTLSMSSFGAKAGGGRRLSLFGGGKRGSNVGAEPPLKREGPPPGEAPTGGRRRSLMGGVGGGGPRRKSTEGTAKSGKQQHADGQQ